MARQVEVTHIAHGFEGGESITMKRLLGGINSGNLNGTRTVGDIIDENTYTFTAGGNANTTEDGGGYVKIVCHAPTTNWDEQAWSAKRGYPAAVTFHENRLCFGGTIAEPDKIWMSQLGKFFNFDVGTAQDTESIQLVAATGDVNEIDTLFLTVTCKCLLQMVSFTFQLTLTKQLHQQCANSQTNTLWL